MPIQRGCFEDATLHLDELRAPGDHGQHLAHDESDRGPGHPDRDAGTHVRNGRGRAVLDLAQLHPRDDLEPLLLLGRYRQRGRCGKQDDEKEPSHEADSPLSFSGVASFMSSFAMFLYPTLRYFFSNAVSAA